MKILTDYDESDKLSTVDVYALISASFFKKAASSKTNSAPPKKLLVFSGFV